MTIHTRWRLTVGVALLALLAAPVAVQADHQWGTYHWERATNPAFVELGDNVDSTWDGWLAEASSDWSASSVLDSPIGPGQAKGKCRPTDGRAEVCNDTYGNTGWLGVAQIWVSGDHITQAIAKLNDTYHNSPPYNTDSWRDFVMCQEVGHVYGLDHQDENFDNGNLGTCMDYTNNPDGPPANRQPDQHDYDQLEAMYAHLDDGGGGGGDDCWPPGQCKGPQRQAPPAFGMPLDTIDQWGRLVTVSRDGGKSVFMQDYGNGFKVLTHVTWTLEVAERLAGRDH